MSKNSNFAKVYYERQGFQKIIVFNCRDKAVPYLTTNNNNKLFSSLISLVQIRQCLISTFSEIIPVCSIDLMIG